MIENFRTKKGWNYSSCSYEKCRKGATRKLGKWACEACNRTIDYPVFRYMLEVVVAVDMTHTVAVMFNDTATELLTCSAESHMGTKYENSDAEDELNLPVAISNLIGTDHVLEIKLHTYYEYGSFESYNCWKIIPNASAEDGASSSTAAVTANDVEHALEDSDVDEVSGPQENTGNSNAKVAVDTQKKRKRQDGRLQSYCGIRLTETTTYYPGVPVTYYDIGPPTYQCRNCGRTPYTFRIDGQNYDRMGSLLPAEGMPPKFAQLYFFDTQNEVRNRTSAFKDKETSENIDKQIVGDLISLLDRYSSVAQSFRMARDWCNTHSLADFRLRLHSEQKITRQYNAPIVFEVAGIIINDFRDAHPPRDIIIDRKDTGLQRGGSLFQQYLVDAYTAVEEQRLKWTRNYKDTLHVALYHNLCDVVTRGDTSAVGLGKRIILPRTFTGSPRYMMHNYQDAMALCRAYGNLDLFITFTSNLKWLEILEMLAYFPGQKPHDRPEIGTLVYVIEFQKRGMPHSHILLWLEENYKCKTPNEIDDIISAEMPSPIADPNGYKVVTDYMLHGPCGKDARNAACTNDGKCLKNFPKPFVAKTFLDEDGYPHYRRRDNKVTFNKGKFMYDNKHVVPHNRYLLLKYKAHINIEWCNRSRAIKYLFKYLNKGPDRSTIVIEENVRNRTTLGIKNVLEVDEIKNYLNCWFLAPCEAVWLFSFDINYSYPSVMQLSFHLPN
nr:hypothetical protein [Tanacetum cinerariifolium]